MRLKHILAALILGACATAPEPPFEQQTLTLTGEITRADHQTYREIPFVVPAGTKRITIDFAYTGKENRTVIDIGLRDPDGQRGWSGGNKAHIEIGEHDATPSYRPGPLQPGEWKLVLGIPNIRAGQTARYDATITFDAPVVESRNAALADLARPRATQPGWRRGDFHTHTWHSDGSCDLYDTPRDSREPVRVPCPAIHTFEVARDAGLDFVAITDHNTITQLADIRERQDGLPDTLLIPGTEITTFNGHANVVGNTDFLDFQLGSPRLLTLAKLFDQIDASGGFISINHPSLPSGEVCMGCGWTVKDTDWSRVSAIEVINGASMRTSGPEGAFNGIAFWESLLKQGHRITAIGGSDNHDAQDAIGAKQSPIGKPATVVYAEELSTKGIIAGVKSGRVFIDAAGLPEASLDTNAVGSVGGGVHMGGQMRLPEDSAALLTARLRNTPENSQLVWVSHNVVIERGLLAPPFAGEPALKVYTFPVGLTPGAGFGYARPELRDASGKLLLLGNPIYFRRDG